MFQKMGNQAINKSRWMLSLISFMILIAHGSLWGEEINFIWIQSFKPGSANVKDATVDQKSLAYVDSLMKRDDIDVTFLGAADNMLWRKTDRINEISSAWDQAKKLERASKLRERYGRGYIGTTDESVRGVKVVWGPKEPSPFELKKRITMLENLTDSLTLAVLALHSKQQQTYPAFEDTSIHGTMTSFTEVSQSLFDWEVHSGVFMWSQGAPYDLTVPYLGIALKRQKWALEFQGGLTPWSRKYADGNRGDAFLMGTFNLFPESWYEFKVGAFSGWEFLTSSDQWTMKVMGMTLGPNLKWKYVNVFVGSNLGKISTLTTEGKWGYGIMVTTSFNFKL